MIFPRIIYICFLALFLSSVSFANPLHYSIIVDAGSSGSRAHLFQSEVADQKTPVIKELFSDSSKPGLSSFKDKPTQAGASLKNILDNVNNELIKDHINPQTVNIQLLATAGMRQLPKAAQQAIYDNVREYIKNHYAFPLQDIMTITGKSEGLYAWLDINYLLQNFQNHTLTSGAIDMGGASTQIAFLASDISHRDDETTLTINGQTYTIFSKSFLGLGEDLARGSINKDKLADTCYPADYPLTPTDRGNFNYSNCNNLFADFINGKHIPQQLISFAQQPFIVFSGAYFEYLFFQVDKTPAQINLEKQIRSVCTKSWEELQKDYPKEPISFLATHCANGIFLDNLFYNTYALDDSEMTVSNSIGKTTIDWAFGAALYQEVKTSGRIN